MGIKIGKCKRNIILIFGCLLIMAILFIPYNSTHVTLKNKTDPYSGIKLRITTKKSGYMFLPQYIKTKATKFYDKDIGWDSYYLNTNLFIIEIAIIILMAGFDYILFCVFLRKPKKRNEFKKAISIP